MMQGCYNLSEDMLHGAEAIREFLGLRNRRQVYHLTDTAGLPVIRIGSSLAARKSTLIGWVEQKERERITANANSSPADAA